MTTLPLQRSLIWFGSCALALYATLGCDKDKSDQPAQTKPVESSAPRAEALDPSLAEAVAQAAKQPAGSKAPGDAAGPPPNGIFAPGVADREASAGARPKVVLGGDGADPKVSLALGLPKPGTKQTVTLDVMQQQGDGGGLPLSFDVSLEVQKPKTEAAEAVPVQARLTQVRIAVPGAPKELDAKVSKLRGAKIEYQLHRDGAASDFRFDSPKGIDPELSDNVRTVADLLAAMTLPLPDRPIGAGAFWMVTSRDNVMGLDLVSYRLVKAERVEAAHLTLKVSTKRYAASSAFDLPGLPPDLPRSMAEFQSNAEGTFEVDVGKPLPRNGNLDLGLGVVLGDANAPKGRGAPALEMRTRAMLQPGKG